MKLRKWTQEDVSPIIND